MYNGNYTHTRSAATTWGEQQLETPITPDAVAPPADYNAPSGGSTPLCTTDDESVGGSIHEDFAESVMQLVEHQPPPPARPPTPRLRDILAVLEVEAVPSVSSVLDAVL